MMIASLGMVCASFVTCAIAWADSGAGMMPSCRVSIWNAGVSGILLVAGAQGWAPTVSLTLVPLAVILGLLTGLVASIVPAWIAGRQHPVRNL